MSDYYWADLDYFLNEILSYDLFDPKLHFEIEFKWEKSINNVGVQF